MRKDFRSNFRVALPAGTASWAREESKRKDAEALLTFVREHRVGDGANAEVIYDTETVCSFCERE